MRGKTIKQMEIDDAVAKAVESYLTSRASEYDSRKTLITEIQAIAAKATQRRYTMTDNVVVVLPDAAPQPLSPGEWEEVEKFVNSPAEIASLAMPMFSIASRAIRELQSESSALRKELDEYEELEAKLCPEDFGFEEIINSLRSKLAAYEAPVTDEEWNAAAEALGERSWAAGESDSRLDEHYRALDTIYNRLCKERDDAVAGAERLVHAKRPKRVRQRQEEGL